MDLGEAKKNVEVYGSKEDSLTDEEEFVYIESLTFLIEKTNDCHYMCDLGGYYYDHHKFDLSQKYYELAKLNGSVWANDPLGYIYYYGRTGAPDYKKAFECYSIASEAGYEEATFKIADMYKNGYYVEKNIDKYKEIIESLYKKHLHPKDLNEPYASLATRMARIKLYEGKKDEAATLYQKAILFLGQRLTYNPFWGDINVLDWSVNDYYGLKEYDSAPTHFGIFDLFYLMKTKAMSCLFSFEGKKYLIVSEKTAEGVQISFEDKWYPTIGDFFKEAKLNDKDPLIMSHASFYSLKFVEASDGK